MKVLHIFSNARKFLKEYPFFNYYFNTEDVHAEILDWLLPGESFPATFLKVPLKIVYDKEGGKKHIKGFLPDLLHCHSFDVLEETLEIGNEMKIPVVFSIYRYTWSAIKKEKSKYSQIIGKANMVFLPNEKVRDELSDMLVPKEILKEALQTSYMFQPSSLDVKNKKVPLTFAVMISRNFESYIRNVHRGVEKILQTNNQVLMQWICFEKKLKKVLQKEIEKKSLSGNVSVCDLENFPLLKYEGIIVDGNQNQVYSKGQYLHFLLSCFKEGKFLISLPEPELEDILIDGVTGIIVPDYSSTRLGHTIHFFISFRDEIEGVSRKAKEYYDAFHSMKVNSEKMKASYKLVLEQG